MKTVITVVLFGIVELTIVAAQSAPQKSFFEGHLGFFPPSGSRPFDDLMRQASATNNQRLTELLRSFSPVTVHRTGEGREFVIRVPGDLTLALDEQSAREGWITPIDREELESRRRAINQLLLENSSSSNQPRDGAPDQLPSSSEQNGVSEPPQSDQNTVRPATEEQVPTDQNASPQLPVATQQQAAVTPQPAAQTQSAPASSEPREPSLITNIWASLTNMWVSVKDIAVGIGLLLIPVAIVALWAWSTRNDLSAEPVKLGRDSEGFEEAQTGVPHAGFRRLKGGFEVALKNKTSKYYGGLKKRGYGQGDNHIVATRDVLVINGKRLRNSECRGFEARGFLPDERGRTYPESILGYYYGTEFYEIPGVWSPKEADEIALALNLHWRALFQTATAESTQADLRNIRPSDF